MFYKLFIINKLNLYDLFYSSLELVVTTLFVFLSLIVTFLIFPSLIGGLARGSLYDVVEKSIRRLTSHDMGLDIRAGPDYYMLSPAIQPQRLHLILNRTAEIGFGTVPGR